MEETDATETENLKQYEVVDTGTRQTLQYLEQTRVLCGAIHVRSSLP